MTSYTEDKEFNNNFKLLPEEVKFYMGSDLSGRIILDLAKDYKIDSKIVYSFVFLIVNSEFNFSLLEEKMKNLNLSGTSLAKLQQDFIGRFLSPIASFMEKESSGKINILNELKRVGGKADDYKSFVQELNELFEEEIQNIIEEEIKSYKNSFNVKEESAYILDLLSNDLISIFDCKCFEASVGLNRGFIYLLSNEDEFKEEALKKILNNKELIGKGKIIVEDRQFDSTVSFWLRDFIKSNGSDMFDDLALTHYLNNSNKIKTLNPQEKSLLGKIINFYKNIAFFPDSLAEVPLGRWQIFYFDSSEYEQELEGLGKTISQEKKDEEGNDSELFVDSLDEDVFEMENKPESEEVKNLKDMLSNYPPSSLERKAIQEEIKKLSQ